MNINANKFKIISNIVAVTKLEEVNKTLQCYAKSMEKLNY